MELTKHIALLETSVFSYLYQLYKRKFNTVLHNAGSEFLTKQLKKWVIYFIVQINSPLCWGNHGGWSMRLLGTLNLLLGHRDKHTC